MTRVHERPARPGASGAVGSVHHTRVEPKKKPLYKVVLEEVAGKKRLKTILSTKQQAPPGYTFIPAGDPQLTSRCKKIAKDEQLTVFIVSTSKFPHERMSTEVHRVGYHFPSTTVDQACMSLGVTLTAQGRVLQSRFAFIDDQAVVDHHQGRRLHKGLPKGKQRRRGRNASPSFDINLSQAVIDTQAREAIKDLFPKIPPDDLHTIIGRAFQKGNGLVGTVSDLSLVRRAQLAVVAHIRHVYTNYDRLLRMMKWFDARSEVQEACLEMLVQWRGDDEDNGEIDDILREVIVIPDDDDDQKDEILRRDANLVEGQHDRSNSVEFISADELDTQTINYANTNSAANAARSPSLESDDDQVQYLGAVPLPYGRPVQYNQQRLERMGAQRHKLWEEAINRRRKNPEIHYAVDNRAELPASGIFGEGQVPAPQRLKDSGRLPYFFEATGRNSAPMSHYSRLIPLPRSEGQADCNIEPHRGEESGFTEQVSYPIQRHHPSRVTRDEEPTIAYYANEPYTRQPVSQFYQGQQPMNGPQDEDERFVQVRDFGRETQNASNPHLYENSPRRHSEMILPSIEGKIPNGNELQQPMSPGRRQKVNQFAQRHANTWEMPRQAIPSVAHIGDDEQPQIKRRKINDQQPLDDHRQRTVLVPLGQAESHGYIHPRPPEPVYHEDTLPFALDKRIIQLPPKETRVCEDSQSHLQVIPHFQSRLVKPEAHAQPQSPTRSIAIQPLYDHQSPIPLRSSQAAPSYREVFEPQHSSRHTYGVAGGDGQMFSDSHAIRERPRQIEEVGGEMRTEFRKLGISSRQGGDHDPGTNRHAWGGREAHASSQALSASHMPVNHQARTYKVDFEKRYQPAPPNIHSESRDMQRQPFIQGGPHESGGRYVPYPFERRPSLPVSGPLGVKWSGLQHSINTFESTNAVPLGNHETREWEVVQNKSVNNGLRYNGAHVGLAYNENMRPAAQSRRKMPDEVVVLE